jgi:hypothetical protein
MKIVNIGNHNAILLATGSPYQMNQDKEVLRLKTGDVMRFVIG